MKDEDYNNYEDEDDYSSAGQDYILEPVEPVTDEPEVTTMLSENTTDSSAATHGDEELVASASASAAIVFLLFFTCFLPFLFMLYYFYIKEGAPVKGNFRLWLLKRLGAADPCSEPKHKTSLESDESQPLIPSRENERMVKSLKGTPRDTGKFRENSRDIYIKMADYPVDVCIQEKETSDDDSSSPDISDELHITRGTKPKSMKKTKPEKKVQAKPVYNRLYDANDSEESEEMFSKYGKNRDIHDFTNWKPTGGGRKKVGKQSNKIPQATEQSRRQGSYRESNETSTGLPFQQHLGSSEDEDEDPRAGQNPRDSQNLSKDNSSRTLFDIS